jgi:hypothetical protein
MAGSSQKWQKGAGVALTSDLTLEKLILREAASGNF